MWIKITLRTGECRFVWAWTDKEVKTCQTQEAALRFPEDEVHKIIKVAFETLHVASIEIF